MATVGKNVQQNILSTIHASSRSSKLILLMSIAYNNKQVIIAWLIRVMLALLIIHAIVIGLSKLYLSTKMKYFNCKDGYDTPIVKLYQKTIYSFQQHGSDFNLKRLYILCSKKFWLTCRISVHLLNCSLLLVLEIT